MRTLALALLGLTACGSDSKDTPIDGPPIKLLDAPPDAAPDAFIPPPPDAPPVYDFSCFGKTQPTTAPANITFSGTTNELAIAGTSPSITPVNGATVEFHKASDDSSLATSVTSATVAGADGVFSQSIATGAKPVDGYLYVTRTNDIPSFLFPAQPAAADFTDVPVQLIAASAWTTLGSFTGQTDANGLILLQILDCSGTSVSGVDMADVHVQQNSVEVGSKQDLSSLSSFGAGLWFVSNVPPGATTISATVQGHAFPVHTVKSAAKTVTLTQTVPGPK